jgi:hypothetical protein
MEIMPDNPLAEVPHDSVPKSLSNLLEATPLEINGVTGYTYKVGTQRVISARIGGYIAELKRINAVVNHASSVNGSIIIMDYRNQNLGQPSLLQTVKASPDVARYFLQNIRTVALIQESPDPINIPDIMHQLVQSMPQMLGVSPFSEPILNKTTILKTTSAGLAFVQRPKFATLDVRLMSPVVEVLKHERHQLSPELEAQLTSLES